MKRSMILLLLLLVTCAPLTRTNFMLKDYVGKPIDTFMAERAFSAQTVTPLDAGGAVYEFRGGPGGSYCRFYLVTNEKKIITKYRFENC